MESLNNFGCQDIQLLLDFAPTAIEYKNLTYSLFIIKGSNRYIVEYRTIENTITVSEDEVSFYKKISLFDTFRSDKSLFIALSELMQLVYDNKEELNFIPRNHIFNLK